MLYMKHIGIGKQPSSFFFCIIVLFYLLLYWRREFILPKRLSTSNLLFCAQIRWDFYIFFYICKFEICQDICHVFGTLILLCSVFDIMSLALMYHFFQTSVYSLDLQKIALWRQFCCKHYFLINIILLFSKFSSQIRTY